MSTLPAVNGAVTASSLLQTLRSRQKQRETGETQSVTKVLEGLEKIVLDQSTLLKQQEETLQQQEEQTREKISQLRTKARQDREEIVAKIKKFSSVMDLQLQNLDRKLSASRGDNQLIDERQKNLLSNIALMKEQLDLLTQEVIGE